MDYSDTSSSLGVLADGDSLKVTERRTSIQTGVDDQKANGQTDLKNSDNVVEAGRSFNNDDIQIIEVDSPRRNQTSIEHNKPSGVTENVISGAGESITVNDESVATEGQNISSPASCSAIRDEHISEIGLGLMITRKELTVDNGQGSSNESSASHPSIGITELKPQISNGANQFNKKSTTTSSENETCLNQAAIKLLQRLEFKNPGRKQIEYGLFNPEESEREKKKLRRFQTTKPRTGVCYKENGMLLDGRDVCDCLAETCPGCFYPCPQCSSKKCGPTCRCNRKWVYDYIEDEGRTYRVEFPEQMF